MDVRLLGPLEVRIGGAPVALGGPRGRSLLALLAMSVGTPVPAARLIDVIWDGEPPASAANTIQVYVSRLRRAMSAAHPQPATTSAGGSAPLRAASGGYLLDLPTDAVDLVRFERLAAAGQALLAAGNPAEAADVLRQALALWRGAPVPDLAGMRIGDGLIARLEAQRLAAVVDRIDADLALGRHRHVVGELDELVRLNPLDEGLVSRLMTALYLTGRQADALAAYAAAARRLADELGVDPGPQLRQVHQRVLRHDIPVPRQPHPSESPSRSPQQPAARQPTRAASEQPALPQPRPSEPQPAPPAPPAPPEPRQPKTPQPKPPPKPRPPQPKPSQPKPRPDQPKPPRPKPPEPGPQPRPPLPRPPTPESPAPEPPKPGPPRPGLPRPRPPLVGHGCAADVTPDQNRTPGKGRRRSGSGSARAATALYRLRGRSAARRTTAAARSAAAGGAPCSWRPGRPRLSRPRGW